jgi:hypothetical protein
VSQSVEVGSSATDEQVERFLKKTEVKEFDPRVRNQAQELYYQDVDEGRVERGRSWNMLSYDEQKVYRERALGYVQQQLDLVLLRLLMGGK